MNCEQCKKKGTKKKHKCSFEVEVNLNECKDYCNCCRSCAMKCKTTRISQHLKDMAAMYKELHRNDW